MKILDDNLTHIETEKPDEIGVWTLVSTEGGRDENGELKVKKLFRKKARLGERSAPKRKSLKLTR